MRPCSMSRPRRLHSRAVRTLEKAILQGARARRRTTTDQRIRLGQSTCSSACFRKKACLTIPAPMNSWSRVLSAAGHRHDLPPSIVLEECRAHFTKIAPDFLKIPGFLRKQYICARDGKVAGGVYMWESQEAAERFYSGEWLAGIRARYGTEPKISFFETVALTDKASARAGGLASLAAEPES